MNWTVDMHRGIILATAVLLLASPGVEAGETKEAAKTYVGAIKKFECGDNCYLTIETSSGEQTGLCEAKQCIPWFENQSMPKKFIGKRVKVVTGVGKQFDGNYDVVGHFLSFKEMVFLK